MILKRLKYVNYVVVIFLLTQCMDKAHHPNEFTAILNYNLSDTSGIVKIGDTLKVFIQIPNPIITTTGESVTYEKIEGVRIGFTSFKIGDTTYCSTGSYRLLTSKGFGFDCAYGIDFDVNSRSFQVLFIPDETGWVVFDCVQNGAQLTVNTGKEKRYIDIKYKFSGKSLIDEMNAQYPCSKIESDKRKRDNIGYYAVKVIK